MVSTCRTPEEAAHRLARVPSDAYRVLGSGYLHVSRTVADFLGGALRRAAQSSGGPVDIAAALDEAGDDLLRRRLGSRDEHDLPTSIASLGFDDREFLSQISELDHDALTNMPSAREHQHTAALLSDIIVVMNSGDLCESDARVLIRYCGERISIFEGVVPLMPTPPIEDRALVEVGRSYFYAHHRLTNRRPWFGAALAPKVRNAIELGYGRIRYTRAGTAVGRLLTEIVANKNDNPLALQLIDRTQHLLGVAATQSHERHLASVCWAKASLRTRIEQNDHRAEMQREDPHGSAPKSG